MRASPALLIAAATLPLAACASTGAVHGSAAVGSRASAAYEPGCIDDGGYAQGYNIPICRTTNDASLWPR